MKNFKYIFIVIALIAIIGVFIYFYTSGNKSNVGNNNPGATRISTNINNISNNLDSKNNNTSNNITENDTSVEKNNTPAETQIATYTTEIKDNSAGRLTNIRITCGIINNTIINPGETFSFNNIVGKPTAERGYQEAKIIINHKSENGIGGGNCQVSSTIYNAALAIPTLTIIERNEHGKDVTYVPEGKDAAVSYGSLDLKFRNDNDYRIKINVASDDKTITATIFKLV